MFSLSICINALRPWLFARACGCSPPTAQKYTQSYTQSPWDEGTDAANIWRPLCTKVGFLRVSTAEQGQSGLGLEAQQASVRGFAAAQGWTLVAEFSDVASGKDDHRPGFQAALTRCRQLGAVLAAARLDRITRRAHTLSQLLEDGYSVRAADMPGADDLMMRVYAAMAQKEREVISERTRAALAAAKARGAVLGGDRGYRPSVPPCAAAASRTERADQPAYRLWFEVERLRAEGVSTLVGLARALKEQGVLSPRGDTTWTHTTVARLVGRVGSCRAGPLRPLMCIGAFE